jgi:demethylmenaquinone methyltransferase/2-methoxy-6-polyprenyl-1,4-benzoquinol methylase
MQEGPEVEADLLADQRAFYRARPPEYDEWWRRRDRYDRGPDDAAEWDRQIQQVTNAADQFGRLGDVLELAGGTGWWSRHLAQKAASLAVIDSSDETLSINRQRVGRTHVTYIVADIFTWRPDRHYDTVLLVLAFPRPSRTLRSILGAGLFMSTARGASIPHRQSSGSHPHSARSLRH